jgi:subtilisin-like proprotein convertase family protein
MKPVRLCYLLSYFLAGSVPAAVVNLDIPDNDPIGLVTTLNVSSGITSIGTVTVTLNVSSTTGDSAWNGDLYAYLTHDNGATKGFAVLLNRSGLTSLDPIGFGDAGFAITLSDTADNDVHGYEDSSPAFDDAGRLTGNWQPDGRAISPFSSGDVFESAQRTAVLGNFAGMDPNGTWVLFIADLAPGNRARLDSWDLTFTRGSSRPPPVITSCASPQSANANANCQAAVPDFTSEVVASGGNGLLTTTQDPPPGTLVGAGVSTVTMTVKDTANQSITCTTTFTVLDKMPPTFSGCPGNITLNTGPSRITCDQVAVWTPPAAADNCPGVELTSDHNPGDNFPVGTTTVTYTAKDAAGNVAQCSFTVEVVDNTPPTIAGCPSDITVTTGPGRLTCDQVATWTPPTATDNCPGVVLTSDHTPGDIFPVGTTTVTYTAKDVAGNTSQCSFKITVVDTTPPAIAGCPSDFTVATGPGRLTCDQIAVWTPPTATDNCPGVVLTSDRNPGDIFPVGTTTVTYTAKDVAGNASQCRFNVNVVDSTPPLISGLSASPSTIWPPNHKLILVNIPYAASDNCAVIGTSLSATSNEPDSGSGDIQLIPGDPHHLYLRADRLGTGTGRIYTVKATATDSHGNVSQESLQVLVPHDQRTN